MVGMPLAHACTAMSGPSRQCYHRSDRGRAEVTAHPVDLGGEMPHEDQRIALAVRGDLFDGQTVGGHQPEIGAEALHRNTAQGILQLAHGQHERLLGGGDQHAIGH